MNSYIKIIIPALLFVAFFTGCDSSGIVKNEIRSNDEFADVTFEEIPEFQNINENSIRNTYIKEVKEKLAEIEGYDKLKSALASLNVNNSAKLLKFKLPANAEELETGEIKQFLKAYSRLIAVKFCLETRVFFNHDLLYMPFGNYDQTYEQYVYWRWDNCLSSDDVFASSKLDYSPFTENELSVLYWSNLLISCNRDKYRDVIAQKLHRMQIFKKAGNSYVITKSWNEKTQIDQNEYHESKIQLQYSIPDPFYYTCLLKSKINNTENDYLGCSCGRSGGGGGFRYRKVHIKPPKQKEKKAERVVPADVINRFCNENILTISEIKGLLESDDIENKTRGTIHLLRYMNANKNYSEIGLLVKTLDVNSPQLAEIVKHNLMSVLVKTDKETLNHIRDFIYKLFEQQNYSRSAFIDLALSCIDKKYLDKYVKLLSDCKISVVENQIKIIDYIVKNKKTEYISNLFDWRFNDSSLSKVLLINVEEFFKKLKSLNRTDSLLKTAKILQSKNNEDAKSLGYLFLKETIGVDKKPTSFNRKSKIIKADATKLQENQVFFECAHLFACKELKNDFYDIVSQNCNINVDHLVYKWFEKESEFDSQLILLRGFAINTLNFTFSDYGSLSYIDPDEEKVDLDARKREIRYQEKRFITLASYVMQSEYHWVQYTLFDVAPYLNATDAWRIIKHFFDINKTNKILYHYFNVIDRLYKDPLGLIDVDKLKRHLYSYIIDQITDYKHCVALIDAIEILAK